MIPHAIMNCKLYYNNAEKLNIAGKEKHLEIRVLDLSVDSFTFRIANFSLKEEDIEKIEINFFEFDKYKYKKIYITDFRLQPEENLEESSEEGLEKAADKTEENMQKFCQYFRVTTEDEDFYKYTNKVMKEYLDYISIKIYGENNEVSEKLVNYPVDKDKDKMKVFNSFQVEMLITSSLNCGKLSEKWDFDMEYGIQLDNPCIRELYLKTSREDFLERYFNYIGLKYHPLKEKCETKINYIYVGNQFCSNLFPKEDELEKIFKKAKKEKLQVALMFPPMGENSIDFYARLFANLSDFEVESMIANDWGMLELIRKNKLEIPVQLGVLLNKRRKDSRIQYKKGDKLLSQLQENTFNDVLVQKFMKERYKIDAYCYESCQYAQNVNKGSVLFYPYYQLNTGAKCTIRGSVRYCDRGKQCGQEKCQYECLKYFYSYPTHLAMVGCYNSLFGYDKKVLHDSKVFRSYMEKGIKRIIINSFYFG